MEGFTIDDIHGWSDRVLRRTEVASDEECWIYQGQTDSYGYGLTQLRGVRRGAHRIVYLSHHCVSSIGGDILRSRCGVRRCVNPRHFDRISRPGGLPSGGVVRDHCMRGHALTEDNVKVQSNNGRRVRRCLRCHQDRVLRSKYGIGVDEYEAMSDEQGGVCAICKRECSSGFRLAVDHCHERGIVRGLLCANCNRGVGLFSDDVARLLSAAEYLRMTGEVG